MKPLSVLCSHELACPGPLQHDQHKHLKQTQTLIYVLLIPDVFNAKNKEDQSSRLPYPLLREKASIALNTLGYKHVSNFGHVSVSQCVQCTNAQNTSHVSLLIHQSILSKKQHLYPPSCQKCAQIVYPRLDFGHVSISQCVQCTNAQNTSHVSLLIHQSILSKKQHPYPPSCQKCAQIVHPRLDKHSKPAHQNKIQSTLYIHESPCPYVSVVLKTARALDLVTLFDLQASHDEGTTIPLPSKKNYSYGYFIEQISSLFKLPCWHSQISSCSKTNNSFHPFHQTTSQNSVRR